MKLISSCLGVVALASLTSVASVASADTGAIDVRVQVRATHGRATIEVAPDDTLHTGDNVEILVSPNTRSYVYVVQIFPDGTSSVLFPDAKEDAQVGADVQTRLPLARTETFELDDVVGVENIYVIASRQPIAKVDEALGKELKALRGSDPAPVQKPSGGGTKTGTGTGTGTGGGNGGGNGGGTGTGTGKTTTGVGAGTTPLKPTPVRAEHMLGMASRGLHKVTKVDKSSILDTAAPSKDDSFVVARFSFKHEH